MVLRSTLFCLLLSVALVFGHILPDGRTIRRPEEKRKAQTRIQSRKQRSVSSRDNHECQEGSPLGASYLGRMNVTVSGKTCQVWSAYLDMYNEPWYPEFGEHNYCRNPYPEEPEGVWCITDANLGKFEYCPVPICENGITKVLESSSQGNHACQDGNPICSPTMMKVLDFSADNDHQPDSNGEFTSATLDAGALPESFTICSAFMVEAWIEFQSAPMFVLPGVDGGNWGQINLFAAKSYTEYDVYLGPVFFVKQTETVFFPLQWTRACLSLDSDAGKVILVVDGQLLGEEEYRKEEEEFRPANLSLVLGYSSYPAEYSVKIANLNVFDSSLSLEKMIVLTMAGEEECGITGNLVSWEEAEWTLHSQAKVIEVDKEWEGHCRKESKVQVFITDFKI